MLLSPVFTGEVLTDSWLAEAQASMAASAWEDAEATLNNVRVGGQAGVLLGGAYVLLCLPCRCAEMGGRRGEA